MNVRVLKPGLRPSLQTMLWLLVLLAAAITIALNASELGAIVDVLHRTRPAYLALLGGVEALFLLNMGLFYASTFRASGVHASIPRFTLVAAAGHFINLVSKTSGFGGLAFYIKEGVRNSVSPLKTTAAYMAAYALGYAAFLATLVISLLLLYTRGSLTRLDVVASCILFVLVLAVSIMMVAGLRSEASLERLFMLATRPINIVSQQLLHKELIPSRRLQHSAEEIFEAVYAMTQRPGRFVIPFGHALAVELLSALGLYVVALSLQVPLSFELAVAAYALSLLFAILTITPAGLGFVEASLVVFLISAGLTRHEAIVVTLGFRLFDFWLPVGVGAMSALVLRLTEANQ